MRATVTAVLFAASIIVISHAAAQESGFGAGVIVGEPTGVSAKLWIGESSAVDAAAAWSFAEQSALQFHADYLLHGPVKLELPAGSLVFHFGGGAQIILADDTTLGVRIPIGLDYRFEKQPIEIFIEAAGILSLVPATDFDVSGGVGGRWYFGSARVRR